MRKKVVVFKYKGASVFQSVPRFKEEMTSKWLQLFEGSGVPYGPINNMRNVFAEPQVCFLKFLVCFG